jgi:hypothetical protein
MPGQDNMGNDLLIGRLDLTPVLDAHVCPLFHCILVNFLMAIFHSMCRINGTLRHQALDLSIFPLRISLPGMKPSRSTHLTCSK